MAMRNLFLSPETPSYGTPFNDVHLTILLKAIKMAFDQMPSAKYLYHTPYTAGFYVDEDQTTSRLVELLNRMLESDDIEFSFINKAVFQTIHREAQLSSVEYGIRKRPDMIIHLVDSGTYSAVDNPLIIECKVIQSGHSKRTVDSYVENGMSRFINSTYSTFSSISIMLAYTDYDCEPEVDLEKYFSNIGLSKYKKLTQSEREKWNSKNPWSKSAVWKIEGAKLTESEHVREDSNIFKIVHMWLYRKPAV